MADPLYFKRHEMILTGLTAETTYYFRLTHTDRSGNVFRSQKYRFTVDDGPKAYVIHLPFVRR